MNKFDDLKITKDKGRLGRWRIGGRIDNRYEVIQIKHGDMGVVYLCYDHEDGIPLAAKTIQDGILMECTSMERSEHMARFTLEAEAWVRLEKHPNIVRALYVSEIEGKPYIFLEYVTGDEQYGVELYDWIHRGGLQVRGKPDIPLILNFSIQFCHGMMYAESKFKEMRRPFVHRDIKPSNILITQNRTAKITDFGLVKSMAELEKGGIVGTPAYMSPEQWINSEEIDTRSDIYSFGGVLYQMVTGRLPFTAENPKKYKECHLNSIPGIPETDEQLKRIIMKCLEKDPARRYQDFNDLEKALTPLYYQLTKAVVEVPEGKALEAEELSNKGSSLYKLGYYDDAIVCLKQSVNLKPNFAGAHFNLGNLYRDLTKLEEATIEYKEAICSNPNFAGAHCNLGTIYGQQGKLKEAIIEYKEANRINPNLADAHYNLGVIYLGQDKLEVAITQFNEAIRINPNHAEAHYNLGVFYEEEDKLEEAVTQFT